MISAIADATACGPSRPADVLPPTAADRAAGTHASCTARGDSAARTPSGCTEVRGDVTHVVDVIQGANGADQALELGITKDTFKH